MSDESYTSYVSKCRSLGLKATKKELFELNEEVCQSAHEESRVSKVANGKVISIEKAKEFASQAYEMGYKEAMREIA